MTLPAVPPPTLREWFAGRVDEFVRPYFEALMSEISNKIAELTAHLDAAITRVQGDLDTLKANTTSPADLAALAALEAKVDAVDAAAPNPPVTGTTPPATGPATPPAGGAPAPAPAPGTTATTGTTAGTTAPAAGDGPGGAATPPAPAPAVPGTSATSGPAA